MAAPTDRRRFLRLAALAGGAAALPGSWRLAAWVRVDGDAAHPGAPIAVEIAADAPSGCAVRLCVAHAGRRFEAPAVPVRPGATVLMAAPYPYDRVAAGHFDVDAELVSAAGAVIERLPAGAYRVRRFRFSA